MHISKKCSNFAAELRGISFQDILNFAFAIYWKLRNVRSFRGIPIISQQTSIVYMGVTYRYMGTSHSLGVDKEALIFLMFPFFSNLQTALIENRHSPNGASAAKPKEL